VVLGDKCQLDGLTARFIDSDLDIVVVRVDASVVDAAARLTHPDVTVLHADTLVHFVGAVGKPSRVDEARVLGDDDSTVVTGLVPVIFEDYRNHYAANPLVAADDAIAGYAEWAAAHVGADGGFVLALGDPILALAAVTQGRGHTEIDLAGVHPEHRGHGLYQVLLDAVEVEAARASSDTIGISTQVHNRGAIRSWVRRGWNFDRADQTFHLVRSGA
jgi:GNAT superfamily N-acetyltransferase